MEARVIGIGDSTPKKKKTLTGAGYAQGLLEFPPATPKAYCQFLPIRAKY
jgi:hypothetical protein